MGKTHISNDLQKRRIARPLLAISLAASLAAVGCTTNLNPGNGTPTRTGPELRSAPTSGVSGGSEMTTPPPMTSSYNRAEVLPRVSPRRNGVIRRSPDEALAIMADQQRLRGRYLGPANPGPGSRPYVSDYNQTFVNPAMLTNPQLTINSSISSPPVSALNNGVGSVAADAGVLAGAVTATGVNAGATIAGTTTGGIAGTGTTVTTGTGVGLPAGTFATVRPAVTESVTNNPNVTAASVGLGRRAIPVTGAATTTTTAATAATTTTTAASTGAATTAATTGAAGAVRIIRGSTGGVTITNTSGSNNQ